METERAIQLAEAAGIERDADDTGEHAEDMVIDAGWLISMKGKAASACAKSSPPFTICRVPKHIRDSDPAAYSPRIISIGPFHRQSTNLQLQENDKRDYLGDEFPKERFKEYLTAREAQARDCYSDESGNITAIKREEFIDMMVLDGCYVLKFILEQNSGDRMDNRRLLLLHDILLLENQLPFFVLECLWVLSGKPKVTLRNEALNFFRRAFPDELALELPEEPKIHHLLHAVHLSLKPARELSSKQPSGTKTVPCAMELQDAGFRFQRKQTAKSFLDVTFEKGLMEIPHLWVDCNTKVLFRNFIAFEHCFPEWGNHFTSYCSLIDALVDTARDVSILTQPKIIEHRLGSYEEVANLFNKLCNGIVVEPENSYLANVFQEVNQHTQKRCPKWWLKLVRDYLSNPWAIISLIAAIITLIVGLVQAFFAVFAYFRPSKP